MVFTTEGFFEVAIESWPEWDLNPRPYIIYIHIHIYFFHINIYTKNNKTKTHTAVPRRHIFSLVGGELKG